VQRVRAGAVRRVRPEAARTKWCPFSRVLVTQLSYPTEAEAKSQTRCISRECMAWRWLSAKIAPGQGFCGLAGERGAP
jgi:hypothetical protein